MRLESSTPVYAALTAEAMKASGWNAKMTLLSLRPNLSVLSGSGANIIAFSGPEGTLMVDTGFSTSQPEITEALASISFQSVRYVINTHWHFDHTDGNDWLHASGATIIAHTEARVRMAQRQAIPEFRGTFLPSPSSALPGIVFESGMGLELNGETIRLRRYSPAHTDGDISVHFERADVLHTGDTWFNDIYPFVDYNSGGSIDGMISAATRNLELAGPDTIVVPGHGKSGKREDLVEYREMVMDVHSKVAEMKGKGLSQEDVIAATPTARYDQRWGHGFIPPDLFVAHIYRGV
jgi:glyoxylase-like metal-dependent hydrolase (beta-lactamase superfamily II)